MLTLLLPIVARVLADYEVEDDGVALAVAEAVEKALEIQDDSLFSALVRSVAQHRAEGKLTASDEAAIVAAGQMARKIDVADRYFEALERDAIDRHLRPPSQDNVSLPTFLRYLDALGMTPQARKEKTAGKSGGAGGRVAAFRRREQQAQSGQAG